MVQLILKLDFPVPEAWVCPLGHGHTSPAFSGRGYLVLVVNGRGASELPDI